MSSLHTWCRSGHCHTLYLQHRILSQLILFKNVKYDDVYNDLLHTFIPCLRPTNGLVALKEISDGHCQWPYASYRKKDEGGRGKKTPFQPPYSPAYSTNSGYHWCNRLSSDDWLEILRDWGLPSSLISPAPSSMGAWWHLPPNPRPNLPLPSFTVGQPIRLWRAGGVVVRDPQPSLTNIVGQPSSLRIRDENCGGWCG